MLYGYVVIVYYIHRVNKEFYAQWKEKTLTVGTTAIMAVIHNHKITVANGMYDIFYMQSQMCILL